MAICCIYCIWNNLNEDCYVGSTVDFHRRIRSHFRLLERKKHHSWKLQKAYINYEREVFDVFILKLSSKDLLLEDEQWCLDIMRPNYNIVEKAGNTLGLKWTEERRIKQLKYLSNKPKSHIDNLKKSLKENKDFVKMSIEKCKSMCEANKRVIIVENVDTGEFIEYPSIIDTAKALGINKNHVQTRLSGIVKSNYKNLKFKYKNWDKQ